ncbi:siroheme synthase CysG [Thiomicrospira sp. ALE5]|uniref:siroheme synthase CysG n=1 Tax=Thiomicrospira sp. ALE5 TaxID=748650 RepID=UPI0008E1D6AD|nr:siroheme synthase CysG [Thiomicrospira sp. ALE5]SFR50004.1 uroporphyrin-III C-methyltransferase / precorrin-2 dehydrogenase / sirohydrochlorin ferrochelatase [Thiomicrospira sp. ALE5]
MDYLPIFMRLKGERVCVIGGGTIAARKSDLFIQAGAKVEIISPELKGEMARMHQAGLVSWQPTAFEPSLITGAKLVLAATDDQAVNEAVHQAATEMGIAVNIADQTELCDYILPSILQRGPITVAVSTGGRSPTFARHLRVQLEQALPTGLGEVALLLRQLRQQYNPLIEEDERKHFWQNLLNSAFYQTALEGRWDEARQICAKAFAGHQTPTGEVFLVGAGPGDPDLLTIKALRILQTADVIVYDRLVSEEIINLTRREAERIYVGKSMSNHTLPQEQINQLLVDLAKQGKKVIRLKGGDPYIFGRGAEEQALLREHGVACTVVPGISSASGIAASTGIPLTHRDYAQSVKLVTGHTRQGIVDLDWDCLVDPNQTLVIYMGLSNVDIITRQLIEHGMNPATPMAVIENGTRANQRVLVTDLAQATEQVAQAQIQAPALMMIGKVVQCVEPSVCIDLAASAVTASESIAEVRYG